MDKKELLDTNLARIMVENINQIDDLIHKFPYSNSQLKKDGTLVTDLDIALSDYIHEIANSHYPGVNYYSEENYSAWKFPKFVVDPLDGTREFIQGRSEWAISVAYFKNENFDGEGWIYNPLKKEVFDQNNSKIRFKEKESYIGEVSRSEWERGLYQKILTEKFDIRPMGSIAYKLGRLSTGKVDFVVSLTPKNIWDIAAGTLLCKQAGFKFYSEGLEVFKVHEKYLPPLIWCHEELSLELSTIFEHSRKGP